VLIVGGNQSAGGYDVDNSLRFNSGSSDYLNRTPSSSSNRKTWTWSAWVKRAKIGSGLFEAMWAVDPSPRQYIAFYQDKLYSYGTNVGDIL